MDDYDVDEEEPVRNYSTEHAKNIIQEATERAVHKASTLTPRLPRPKAPKFGPQTLLGTRGFRLLRKQLADKMEYSGDTMMDLDRLMGLYLDWSHHMYPRFIFKDVIDKVERQCRTAPMRAYLLALQRSQEEGGDFDEMEFVAAQDAAEANAALEEASAILHDVPE